MNRGWAEPFRHRGFSWLFVGQFVSAMGDWISYVILPLMLYRITSDPVSIGILMVCRMLPSVLLAPLVGRVLAKASIVRVLMLADLVRGLAYLGMLWMQDPVWIYVLTLVIASGSAFFNPGKVTLIPQLVPSESLARANSYVQGANQFMMLFGPAVGGVLFALIGLEWGLVFNGLSFFVSMLALIPVRVAHGGKANQAAQRSESSLRRYASILRGLQKRRRIMMMVISCSLAVIGFGGTLSVLIPVVAEEVFHSQAVYGWFMSCLGGGLFLGTMLSPTVQRSVPRYLLYALGTLAGGLCVGLFGGSSVVVLSIAAIFLVGTFNGIEDIASTTYLQMETAESGDTADVFALLESLQAVTMVLAMTGSTWLAGMIGVQKTIMLFALFPLGCGLLMTADSFRRKDNPFRETKYVEEIQ